MEIDPKIAEFKSRISCFRLRINADFIQHGFRPLDGPRTGETSVEVIAEVGVMAVCRIKANTDGAAGLDSYKSRMEAICVS